eukprot:SAG11_NODE_23286_length_391_cov_1.239726_1_plen_125_part_01
MQLQAALVYCLERALGSIPKLCGNKEKFLVIPDEVLRKAFRSIGMKAAHWHYQRAVTRYEMDQHIDAQTDLLEALRLNPDHHYAPELLRKVNSVVNTSKLTKRLAVQSEDSPRSSQAESNVEGHA